MSTIYDPAMPVSSPPAADPFRHGWRYVRVTRPDGSVDVDQVPLSLEDVLHPEEGDVNLHCEGHDEDCKYLKAALQARLAANPTALVLSDCRVDFSTPGVRPLGPDIVVFFDSTHYTNWYTFEVAAEGVRPVLVIEVTSPDYRKNDFVAKLDYYHRAGVPLYVIVDSDEPEVGRRIDFYAYRNTPEGYERIELAERRVWLEPVGLWLEVTESRSGERVSLYDPQLGQDYGTYVQEFARAQAERDRAEAESDRADAASTLAIHERARANAEKARADNEARARVDLEEQVRRMSEELKRFRSRD